MRSTGNFPKFALLLYLFHWLADATVARRSSCGLPECPSEGETSATTETTKAIIAVMSVTILLIICLIVVLIMLCMRKHASETHDNAEAASEAHPCANTLRQIEENAVEIPGYICERQMSLASTYSGPPPYFSIFKIVSSETGEARSTCIGDTNAVLNFVTSVESIEECPPDYEGLFEHLPPTYEQVSTSHQKKEVT